MSLAVLLLGGSAMAQPMAPDSPEAHIERGLELRRAGQDAAALAEFRRAQSISPEPRVGAQIGFALQALGRWREAEETQLRVLAEGTNPWVREHADVVRESLAAAQRHLAWLSVECEVAGAELSLDGAPVARIPLSGPVRVVAGAVVLEVRADGYDPVRRTIDVPAGAQLRETFALVRALPMSRTSAGEKPERERAPGLVDAGAGARAAGWVALIGGGVLASGGVAALLVSNDYSEQYNDPSCLAGTYTREQNCGSDRGVAEATRTTAIIAFAAAGLAVGTGVWLLLTSPPPSSARAIGRTPEGSGRNVSLGRTPEGSGRNVSIGRTPEGSGRNVSIGYTPEGSGRSMSIACGVGIAAIGCAGRF
jgi:hypothetical protein